MTILILILFGSWQWEKLASIHISLRLYTQFTVTHFRVRAYHTDTRVPRKEKYPDSSATLWKRSIHARRRKGENVSQAWPDKFQVWFFKSYQNLYSIRDSENSGRTGSLNEDNTRRHWKKELTPSLAFLWHGSCVADCFTSKTNTQVRLLFISQFHGMEIVWKHSEFTV